MIPPYNTSLVLPPYLGATPVVRANMSPYKATMLEIVTRFSTSKERAAILTGLIAYRKALLGIGMAGATQWFAGSFLEDVEQIRKAAPQDIDIVTFHVVPGVAAKDRQAWYLQNIPLFDRNQTKPVYKCDAFLVDLAADPWLTVGTARYWFGLFSHQRDTSLWKGLLEVPLTSDDGDADAYLQNIMPLLEGSHHAQETGN